jgi:hypothetical protein
MNKNIKRIMKGTGCESVDWIQLAQDRIQRQAVVNRGKETFEFYKCTEFFNS